MKKILFAIAIVMFAVSCGDSGDGTPAPPAPKWQKYAKSNEIKIMSFNIRTSGMDEGTANHWDNRKEACVALIKDHMPDIMGVQEATYTAQWVWLKEQLKSVGYDGYGIDRINGYPEFNNKTKNGEVPGILWNTHVVKILDKGTFWLSETPDTPSQGWDAGYYRSATWGLFEHIPTGKQFFYINTHLDHESVLAQEGGMKVIDEKFQEYYGKMPLFLTGDLNVDATNKALDVIDTYMNNAGIKANKKESFGTTNGWGASTSNKVIDHIYYSKTLRNPVEYRCIRDAYKGVTYVSDHYPIYAIIKL